LCSVTLPDPPLAAEVIPKRTSRILTQALRNTGFTECGRLEMKVYVTGGTGFIGTEVMRQLAEREHDLTCLVRKTSNTGTLEELGVPTVVGDVTDRASIERTLPGHDALIHLANVYDFWLPDKRVYHDVNVTGTRNVMEAALAAKVAKVIHVSTCLIFGSPAECPFDEECPPGSECFSEYAQTKREGTEIALAMHQRQGLPLVTVYPSGVVGPDDPKATGRYLAAMATGKLPAQVFTNSRLTFTHVRDVAAAIVAALEKPDNIGEDYLVGGETVTFGQINRWVEELSGRRPPPFEMAPALVMLNARLLTAIADLIKRPPLWDMSVDQMRTMRKGYEFSGEKVARELGITYTPLREAVAESLASWGVKTAA